MDVRVNGKQDGDQYSLPLAERYPELAAKLGAVARQLCREIGAITSADIWKHLEVHDRATFLQAKKIANGRIMSTAFNGADWVKTPERRPLGSHGREIPVWCLREKAA